MFHDADTGLHLKMTMQLSSMAWHVRNATSRWFAMRSARLGWMRRYSTAKDDLARETPMLNVAEQTVVY